MKTLSLYGVTQQKIIDMYNIVDDPNEQVFDTFFVEMTTILAAYGDSLQNKMACLCARALLGWNATDRENFLASVEVPASVWRQLANPDDWPNFNPEPQNEEEVFDDPESES